MNIKGKIKVIEQPKTFGSFTKRNVVLTTDEKYPQDISVEFHNDKTSLLDKYKKGDVVDILINIRGKEWTSPQGEVKYFNSLVGWKIEGEPIPDSASKPQPIGEDNDLLPF